MKKSNILVVTRNLPPLVGGMERLLWHVIDALRHENNVHVVGPTGCREILPTDVHVVEVPSRSLTIFLFLAMLTTSRLAMHSKPSIILAGSGLMAPIVWIVARLRRVACLVYLHGLDIRVAHGIYQRCWLPFFRHFDAVVVNSDFTRRLAVEAGVPHDRIHIVHPGVELPAMENAVERARLFRAQHDLGQGPVLLSVGRMTVRKGLSCFIEHIFPKVLSERPDVILVVIGGAPVHALHGGADEPARVDRLVNDLGFKQKIRFLGQCSDTILCDAYFAADVLIFPVQESDSDIEGFGMVALEAAAHGLPTVAFSVGGVPDAVADGLSGALISPGANDEFARAVLALLQPYAKGLKKKECRNFAQTYAWTVFGEKILNKVRVAIYDR